MDRASLGRLGRQPGYPLFYVTATVTRLADEMFSVGAVLLVLHRTGSAALAGATVAAVTLPSVVSGPMLGAWLDRSGRRSRVMIVDQLLAASTLIGLVLLAGHAPDWTLPLVALVAGITWPLSFGGFTSLIPVIVPGRLLASANALEATSFNVAVIAGPALAGTISAIAGPATSLLVEAVLTIGAIALIARLPALDVGTAASTRPLKEIVRAGLRHLAATPPLRAVTAIGALNLLGLGLLTVAFPYFAVDVLDTHRSVAGYLWAAFAAGSTLGALALVRLQTIWAPERVVMGSVATLGLLMLLWPLATTLPVALLLVALAGVADGPNLASTFAVRQRWTPRALHGQIFTTAASVKVGSFALGAAVAGPTVLSLGARGALVLAGCIQLAAVAAGLIAARGERRPEHVSRALPLELEDDDDVHHEDDGERDRPAVQVALDERTAAERPPSRATDPERARKTAVLSGVQQHEEDQDHGEEDLNHF